MALHNEKSFKAAPFQVVTSHHTVHFTNKRLCHFYLYFLCNIKTHQTGVCMIGTNCDRFYIPSSYSLTITIRNKLITALVWKLLELLRSVFIAIGFSIIKLITKKWLQHNSRIKPTMWVFRVFRRRDDLTTCKWYSKFV